MRIVTLVQNSETSPVSNPPEYTIYDGMPALLYTSSTCYVNEEEREIHLWASQRDTQTNQLVLLGGFFIDEAAPIKLPTLFSWIDVIIKSPPEDDELCLVSVQDPRQHDLPPATARGAVVHESTQLKLRNMNDVDAVKGHYILCLLSRTKRAQVFKNPVVRGLVPPGGSGKYNRDDKVAKEVRERDRGCVATGARAPPRIRGENHVGLHVAHLYPLAWRKESVLLRFKTLGILSELAFKALAASVDKPYNLLEFKANVHNTFDDFQFGFWDGNIHRFEKNGAPFLEPGITRLVASPVSSDLPISYNNEIDPVMADILQFHFKYSLLVNCAAGGRKPAGKSAVHPSPIPKKEDKHRDAPQ